MADNSGMDMSYILNVLQGILDSKTQVDPVSQMFYNDLLDNFDAVVGTLKDANKINKTELNKIAEYVKKTLSSNYGVQYTQQFKDLIAEFKEAIKVSIGKKESVDATKVVAGFSNIISTAISQSLMAEKRGDKKGALLKNTTEANAKVLAEEVVKKLGLEGMLDKGIDKVLTFLGATNKDNQKKQKGLLDDLVDALGKGRLGKIGQDIFRVVGFMGARWLSQFGQFGKIMGGLFYVAMESFAPILAEVLMRSIGNLIVMWGGRIVSAIWGSKVMQGLRSKEGLILGGSLLAGGAAIASGVDSVKSGRTGNGAALIAGGLGIAGGGAILAGGMTASAAAATAGTLGATGLAGALGAIAATLNPIGATVLGIGAAVAGIAYLWKKFHKRNQDKDEKDKEEKSWWQNFIDWIKDHWPFGGGGSENNNNNNGPMSELPGGGGVNRPGGKAREYDLKHSKDIGGFKVAPDGSILNFHELTQAQGAKAIEAYKKQDPESFNRVFELVDPRYVQQGSFATDKGVKKNGKFWALSYKGAGQDIETARKELAPILGKKSENLVMSGGVASKEGPHHVPKLLKNFFKSHYNQYGEALDLVGEGWNLDEYYNAWQKLSALYGKKGFVVNYENPDGTFAKSRKDMRPGGHFDIKKTRDTRSEGAVENLKVKAQRQNIVSQKMIEDRNLGGGTDAFFDWMKEHKLGKKEDWNSYEDWMKRDLMDGYLKHRGIRRETNEKSIDEYYTYGKGAFPGTSKKTGRIDVEWGDPSGNSAFDNMKFKLNGINQLGADR